MSKQHTFVMDVNTFSKTALGWALRLTSVRIWRKEAHGPAIHLQNKNTHTAGQIWRVIYMPFVLIQISVWFYTTHFQEEVCIIRGEVCHLFNLNTDTRKWSSQYILYNISIAYISKYDIDHELVNSCDLSNRLCFWSCEPSRCSFDSCKIQLHSSNKSFDWRFNESQRPKVRTTGKRIIVAQQTTLNSCRLINKKTKLGVLWKYFVWPNPRTSRWIKCVHALGANKNVCPALRPVRTMNNKYNDNCNE